VGTPARMTTEHWPRNLRSTTATSRAEYAVAQLAHATSSPWPDEVLTTSLPDGSLTLQSKQGGRFSLDQGRWHGDPSPADLGVLARCRGSVLDVGCGPGRLVHALVGIGHVALGIDTSRAAIAATRRRGAPATHTSVFGRVPWVGNWDTALLLDGNIGIGGDTRSLLARTLDLIAPDGLILVEVESPACASVDLEVRVERGNRVGSWFPWSRVAANDVEVLAQSAGLVLEELWQDSGRWFAQLAPAMVMVRVMEEEAAS
jgi:SAM-dependent methyltransferase